MHRGNDDRPAGPAGGGLSLGELVARATPPDPPEPCCGHFADEHDRRGEDGECFACERGEPCYRVISSQHSRGQLDAGL